jgi:TPR repeat protein
VGCAGSDCYSDLTTEQPRRNRSHPSHGERGAAAGDAKSQDRLAALYASGEEVPQDLEKALLHYAIAADLFEAAGVESDALTARAHPGSIARALSPQDAVKVARQVADWRPNSP